MPSCARHNISNATLKPRSQGLLRGPPLAARVVLAAALAASSGAAAEVALDAGPVIVLQPTTASSALRRSLARIRNELSADQFQVILADSGAAVDPAAIIESAGEEPMGGAVLAVFGDPETGVAELCVVQRAGRRVAVRRATVTVDDPERMPEALSARALELLRASALELAIGGETARPRRAPPEPNRVVEAAARPAAPVAPAEDGAVAVEMGLGILHSIDGPPPAVIPVGRTRVHVWSWLAARATVAGLGTRPRVDSRYGSATVSQSLALLELAGAFRSGKRVRLAASLGAGAVHVSVAGVGAGRYEGRDSQRWSAAFGGGLGVAFAIGSRAALTTEIQAMVASPHPIVRFVDAAVATVGYPSFLLTATLQVMP